MNRIININNLSKSYYVKNSSDIFDKSKKKINALNDISFSVHEGESVGLIGLNGSGKSSLIKIILGILKEDSGHIEVFSKNPFNNRKYNSLDIGVVFGQRSQLRWDISAMDSFNLIRHIYKIPIDKFEKQLSLLDKYLSFKEFFLQPVRTLSLGQRMRVELAASLLHDPKLIILDEPTNGLDVLSRNKIIGFIKEELTKKNKTLVYTSHYLDEIRDLCNKIIILNKGNIVCNQKTDEFYNKNSHKIIRVHTKNKIPTQLFNFVEVQPFTYEMDYDENSKELFYDFLISNAEIVDVEILDNSLEYFLSNN